ncbi:Uncharacterised protein [Collinsella intestinalis]|nr:Uncharacterised protein [Collinsella intestinalis]
MALKEGRDLARTVGGLYDGACRTIHIKGRDLLVINGGFGRSGRRLSPIGFGRRIDVVNTVGHGNERGLSTFSRELAAQIDEGVLIAIRLIFDCGGRRPGSGIQHRGLTITQKSRLGGTGIVEQVALNGGPAERRAPLCGLKCALIAPGGIVHVDASTLREHAGAIGGRTHEGADRKTDHNEPDDDEADEHHERDGFAEGLLKGARDERADISTGGGEGLGLEHG